MLEDINNQEILDNTTINLLNRSLRQFYADILKVMALVPWPKNAPLPTESKNLEVLMM
jgi:hypothetical protein